MKKGSHIASGLLSVGLPVLIGIILAFLLDTYIPNITLFQNITINLLIQVIYFVILNHIKNIRIEESINKIKLVEKIDKIALKSNRFNEILGTHLGKIEDLANGLYETHGHPTFLWQEHIDCIKHLKKGEEVRITCYFPEVSTEITRLFSFKKYHEYCDIVYKLPEKGIEVSKIFIVKNEELLKNQKLIEHFNSIKNKKCRFYLIVISELDTRDGIPSIEEDFMIWGDKLLSVSLLGDGLIVGGLKMYSDEKTIASYKSKFNRLKQISTTID